MNVGLKIKKLREQKNISQNELAKKAGIAQSTLSYIESEDKKPTIDTLQSIANALYVDIASLVTQSEDTYDPVDAKANELFQKRKILFDKSAKASVEDLDKIEKLMDIIIGNKYDED